MPIFINASPHTGVPMKFSIVALISLLTLSAAIQGVFAKPEPLLLDTQSSRYIGKNQNGDMHFIDLEQISKISKPWPNSRLVFMETIYKKRVEGIKVNMSVIYARCDERLARVEMQTLYDSSLSKVRDLMIPGPWTSLTPKHLYYPVLSIACSR